MRQAEGEDRDTPGLDSAEKQQVERANQIFLRLKKQMHDRDEQLTERDLGEAAQGARWLREIVEQHSNDLHRAYEDALTGSDLPEEDRADLRRGVERAEGFSSFVRRNLQRLEEADPDEGETGDPASEEITRRDLVCGVATGLLAGGVIIGNFFYFGFVVGMSRKSECW